MFTDSYHEAHMKDRIDLLSGRLSCKPEIQLNHKGVSGYISKEANLFYVIRVCLC